MKQFRQQSVRGSALLTALFIMTMVAIAATAITARLQLDIYRLRLTINSERLYLASQAVLFWSMDALKQPKKTWQASNQDGEILSFPQTKQFIYPGVKTTGALYDLQSRFNINNLQDKAYRNMLHHLLSQLVNNFTEKERLALVQSAYRWVTPPKPSAGRNSDFSGYLQQKPPYYPALHPMSSISEMRLLKGMTQDIYNRLLPYMIALPEITPINIKTAPKTILMLLGNGLTEAQAKEIIRMRRDNNGLTPRSLAAMVQKYKIPPAQITTESHYFLSVAKTSTDHLTLINYTILQVKKNSKGKRSVDVIFESLNTL